MLVLLAAALPGAVSAQQRDPTASAPAHGGGVGGTGGVSGVAGVSGVSGSALVIADQGRQPVDAAVLVHEDPSSALGLAQMRALPAARWRRPVSLPVSPGLSRSAWWVRLEIRNADAGRPVSRLFEIGSAVQDRIDIFVLRRGGTLVQTLAPVGDRVPFANRPVRHVNPTVPLDFAPGETVELYLRLTSHDGLQEQIPLTLWTAPAFAEAAQRHWLASGLYYGLLGTLLIYNVFLFVATRQRTFAWYGGYILSTLVWGFTFSGDGLYLLWPDSPVFNNQILALTIGAWFVFGALFLSGYLRLRKQLPRCHRWLQVVSALCLVCAVPALFGHYAVVFATSLPLGLVWAAGMGGCALVLLRRGGTRAALWSLIAWSPLVAAAAVYSFRLLALPWLPPLASAGTALQLAAVAQMLLLGLGVADTTHRWRQQRIEAERRQLKAQEVLAATLEAEVAQRTGQLKAANARLQELATTDALTGVFNRRHFNESIEAEIKRLQRSGEMPALCLIDVDHFKAYNDLYGHHKGDAALKAVADVLRRSLRRAGDRVFRVGGEEFALLLLPGEAQAQARHVDELRRAIEQLRLPHAGNPPGVVTASFGLVQSPPFGASVSSIYKEADRLLYRAKTGGRNRVVSDAASAAEWRHSTDFAPDHAGPPA